MHTVNLKYRFAGTPGEQSVQYLESDEVSPKVVSSMPPVFVFGESGDELNAFQDIHDVVNSPSLHACM